MRRLVAVVGVVRGVLDLGIELVLGLVVYAWGALLALALAGVILLTCAGCAVEGEGVSSGSCATCGGKGVNETKAKDVVLCAVLAGCASEGVSVDVGVDAEGPTRGPGVADSAGLADGAGAVLDVVVGVDAGADVARVVDVGADLAAAVDARVIWDLPTDTRVCSQPVRDLQGGGVCVWPGGGESLWTDRMGNKFSCVWSGVISRSCWTWDLFDRKNLTFITLGCSDCLNVVVTP